MNQSVYSNRTSCHDCVAVAQVLQEEFESILLDPACVAWLSVRGTQIQISQKANGRVCLMRVDEMCGIVFGGGWLFWGMFWLYCPLVFGVWLVFLYWKIGRLLFFLFFGGVNLLT